MDLSQLLGMGQEERKPDARWKALGPISEEDMVRLEELKKERNELQAKYRQKLEEFEQQLNEEYREEAAPYKEEFKQHYGAVLAKVGADYNDTRDHSLHKPSMTVFEEVYPGELGYEEALKSLPPSPDCSCPACELRRRIQQQG